jgi:hypothetical protein
MHVLQAQREYYDLGKAQVDAPPPPYTPTQTLKRRGTNVTALRFALPQSTSSRSTKKTYSKLQIQPRESRTKKLPSF